MYTSKKMYLIFGFYKVRSWIGSPHASEGRQRKPVLLWPPKGRGDNAQVMERQGGSGG
jgi:hypothetical protein